MKRMVNASQNEIRSVLECLGKTHAVRASKLGVSQATVFKWLRNETVPLSKFERQNGKLELIQFKTPQIETLTLLELVSQIETMGFEVTLKKIVSK